jgi:hypothetical protein
MPIKIVKPLSIANSRLSIKSKWCELTGVVRVEVRVDTGAAHVFCWVRVLVLVGVYTA